MFKYQVKRNLDLFNPLRICNKLQSNLTNFHQRFFFTTLFGMKSLLTGNKMNLNSTAIVKTPMKCFSRSVKSKRKMRMPDTSLKIRNHKGMLKRIRIVGPRWDRQFKFYPVGNVHKMTNKSRANLKRKRQARFISPVDIKRVRKLIPYFKRKKYKH